MPAPHQRVIGTPLGHDQRQTALPILTFDEGRLSPSYGHFFAHRWLAPQETIVSIAWKFARINALPGQIVARQFSQQ